MKQSREVTGYKIIKDISYREAYDFSAPVGMTREFRFKLDDEIARDTTLVFQFSHQNAEVYIDDEKVYSLKVSDELSVRRRVPFQYFSGSCNLPLKP